MKRISLQTMIAARFAVIVLTIIFLISFSSNILINRQFEKYIEKQRRSYVEELAQNLSGQYVESLGGWNIDYVYGLGMYALNEGYIIKLYDSDENILWDAEHHDMTLCHQMMEKIKLRMQENRPDLSGDFITQRFELTQFQKTVGYLDISYYSPYYLSENDFHFIEALNKILLSVGMISLVAAVVVGVLLAANITEPIIQTVEITKQISDGNYDIRFMGNVKTKELYGLVESVEQMACSLKEQESLRKRLTSDVAHELRTPIANVLSYLETIIEGVWEPTPERLRRCYDELERISGLVADLEQLQRIENDNANLQKTTEDLFNLTESVVKNFESQFAEKKMQCRLDGDHVLVAVDRKRMQQVVTNLVSNAIKYSDEGGFVHLSVADRGDEVHLCVEDHGIGIAEEEQKRVFERFYRTDVSRNRKTGGSGIGLAIVKALVLAHGGRILLESEAGKGSKFTVVLPKEHIAK